MSIKIIYELFIIIILINKYLLKIIKLFQNLYKLFFLYYFLGNFYQGVFHDNTGHALFSMERERY